MTGVNTALNDTFTVDDLRNVKAKLDNYIVDTKCSFCHKESKYIIVSKNQNSLNNDIIRICESHKKEFTS